MSRLSSEPVTPTDATTSLALEVHDWGRIVEKWPRPIVLGVGLGDLLDVDAAHVGEDEASGSLRMPS